MAAKRKRSRVCVVVVTSGDDEGPVLMQGNRVVYWGAGLAGSRGGSGVPLAAYQPVHFVWGCPSSFER